MADGGDVKMNRYKWAHYMADRLIPRAVAYSAGFMDYFFRGRIEAEGTPDTATRSLA